MKNMHKHFKVGDNIYGYCGGEFGRESYSDKTCVMVSRTYAIFVDDKGVAYCLNDASNYKPSWKDPSESYGHHEASDYA